MNIGDIMFRIGEFSKFTQVSVRMLRHYDEVGLFIPLKVDKFTGYRYYSAKQIPKLNKIIALRDMGFLIAEIALIINEDSNDEKFLTLLEQKKLEVTTTITCENNKLQRIESMIKSIGKERLIVNYEVTIKSVPAYKVVSLRDIIPAYNREGDLWVRLGEFIEENKISCVGTSFAMYHDQEYKEKDVDVEVAIGVEELLPGKDGITFRETEAVPSMASLMVVGPFENIAPAFNAMAKWVEDSDYVINGISRQVCHKGPWNEENPEDYLTEIQIPVTKK